MRNPWVTAIKKDLRDKPTNWFTYNQADQALRPLKVGDKVFLYDARPNEPAYGQLAKVTHIMKIVSYYRVVVDLGKKKK